jgi:hypothetical protein
MYKIFTNFRLSGARAAYNSVGPVKYSYIESIAKVEEGTLHVHTVGGGKTPCTSILWVVERHPARPYCWWWKDTLHFHTVGGGKNPARPYYGWWKDVLHVHTAAHPGRPYCWWWKDTLHVHTVGGGKAPSTSIMLMAKITWKIIYNYSSDNYRSLCHFSKLSRLFCTGLTSAAKAG